MHRLQSIKSIFLLRKTTEKQTIFFLALKSKSLLVSEYENFVQRRASSYLRCRCLPVEMLFLEPGTPTGILTGAQKIFRVLLRRCSLKRFLICWKYSTCALLPDYSRLESILLENERHWMICVGLFVAGPGYNVPFVLFLVGLPGILFAG